MKAILIDAKNKKISTVDYNGKLEDIYKLLNCKTIDRFYINDECCYIDDEGLYNSKDIEFYFNNQIFYGNGLIVGTGMEGDDIDTVLSLDETKKLITFPYCKDGNWMLNLFNEKGFELEDTVNGEMTIRELMNHISRADTLTQDEIKKMLVKIDVVNGDIMHFLNFMASQIK